MLSLIEVTCPHCGAKGQIMLPPMGAIIMGPCPECQGLVVVFCGQVLPLDKSVMLNGSIEERRDHLMGVMTQFLEERVTQMLSEEPDASPQSEEPDASAEEGAAKSDGEFELVRPDGTESPQERKTIRKTPITAAEVQTFNSVDLKLLDNIDYFRAIFG